MIRYLKMQYKLYLLVRKLKSFFSNFDRFFSTLCVYFYAFLNPLIDIKKNCQFGKSVKILATDKCSISIGARVSFGDRVQVVVSGGKLTIEDDVFIGCGSIVVCREEVFIGRDTLIAEYVVIRDQDHCIDSRPVRNSGFHTSPIHIGQDVWVGCKASILRGSTVGDRCVIGAHSLVKSHIEDDMLALGTPAKAIKRVDSRS